MAEKNFQELLQIAKKLRGKNGCPWDKKQTIATLMPLLQDELEELKEGINKKDYLNIAEEIGGILFNLILMAQILSEEKKSSMPTILQAIKQKIISRHTWVFGKDKAKTADEAIAIWKKNKQKEKKIVIPFQKAKRF